MDDAQASGAWEEMNEVDALMVPQDLEDALTVRGQALGNFTGFPPSVRRNILRWIASARTDATRQRRIDRIASDAQRNVRTPVNG